MKKDEQKLFKKVYLVAKSQIFPIRKIISKIGRQLDNDIVIQDSLISRYHAEILIEDEKYYLSDKKSTGGTYLNNKKIEKEQIQSGDTIILANTPLLFMVESHELNMDASIETGTLSIDENLDSIVSNETTKPIKK